MPYQPQFKSPQIVGRYAPSPTGDLHFGNLRTALLAWLHARLQGGQFIVRMEDLDLPRVVAGSADQILRDLEWLGLDWDGPIVYQSERTDLYQRALLDLDALGLCYPCFCSRKDIQVAASAPHGNAGVYPGTCRLLSVSEVALRARNKSPAIRLKVPPQMAASCGDFVILRSDAFFAYQLAVTVDDLEQAVTEVVRGADLIDSTPKQVYLAELLQPKRGRINYLHAPLMLDDKGRRMSKRDGSISAKKWRQGGGSSEQLLAHLVTTAGIFEEPLDCIALEELIERVDIKRIAGKLSPMV
ncbi:MAG: glutamyl-tRNA synthetase [Arenicella sp.]|jgi:glutamyl-tRNA synthetase